MIRELMTGPKRYKDFMQRLPGVGTNLLAKRLKHLEAQGVLERRALPPPVSTNVYALTDLGLSLQPLLVGLARWGFQTLRPTDADASFFPEWALLAFQANFEGAGVTEEYEFRVGAHTFHLRIATQTITSSLGASRHPECTVKTDPDTFLAIIAGSLTPQDAARLGRIHIYGDRDASYRCAALMDISALRHRATAPVPTIDLTGRGRVGPHILQ